MKKINFYILVLGLLTLLIACGPRQAEDTTTTNEGLSTQELNNTLDNAVDSAAESIEESAETIQEGASNAAEATTEALNNSGDAIQNGLETSIDATTEAVENLNDNARLIAAKTKARAELVGVVGPFPRNGLFQKLSNFYPKPFKAPQNSINPVFIGY